MIGTFLDTIAAIATPQGAGGVGIVRVSGPLAKEVVGRLFRSSRGHSPAAMQSHRLYHGTVHDPRTGARIDEVLCVVMRKPASFTGETVAEFHGHGGPVVLRMILESVLAAGARLAEPGEFSRRAFLHGRIDLVQAEAVLDVINARTDGAVRIAQAQLEGRLSHPIRRLRRTLLGFLAEVEAGLDFPEEEIPPLPRDVVLERLHGAREEMRCLLAGAERGRILRDGLLTVIVGRPNVGKSSLWNALLREERAIVTPIPGTTRDPMQEYVSCLGVPLKLVDTAGMRATEEPVERIGVSRAREWMSRAELLLLVLDQGEPLQDEDRELLARVRGRQVIGVLNKGDLRDRLTAKDRSLLNGLPMARVSLKEGWGLETLEREIRRLTDLGSENGAGEVLVNVRHKDALRRALDALGRVEKTVEGGYPLELVTGDLRDAVEALGLITGENITDELVKEIFSRFCLGK